MSISLGPSLAELAKPKPKQAKRRSVPAGQFHLALLHDRDLSPKKNRFDVPLAPT